MVGDAESSGAIVMRDEEPGDQIRAHVCVGANPSVASGCNTDGSGDTAIEHGQAASGVVLQSVALEAGLRPDHHHPISGGSLNRVAAEPAQAVISACHARRAAV